MGTWISHLRIAENLIAQIDDLDKEAFIFGNLAPDSGKPNKDWTQFDPPKQVTHFLYKGEGEGQIRDLHFYHQYLHGERPANNQKRYSFLLGYFFHLLCDSLWAKWIVAASKRDFKALIEKKGNKAWEELKRDWYGLDQLYVRDHQQSSFWQIVMPSPYPSAYLPYLSEEAFHHQLDYIRQFYSKPDPIWRLDRSYPYLNEITMLRYVNESTLVILEVFKKFWSLSELQNEHTALSLIPVEKLRPYDFPLGDQVE